MTDNLETGAVADDGAAEDDAVAGRDRLVRGLILETAGVDLLLGPGRRRASRRRRALFQYTALLAATSDG